MAEPAFSHPDDDLPRTLRREREARQRGSQAPAYAATPRGAPLDMPSDGVSVTRFDVRLAWFLVKCVVAGIPAMILFVGIMVGIGNTLQKFAPEWIVYELHVTPKDVPKAKSR
jgi:hypothetical protein